MPTIEENKAKWGEHYDLVQAGEKWSRAWGGVESQWWGMLWPRIHAFVPATTILEIAPGFGRWTHYLKSLCQRLIVVDLNERCIEACQKRFAECSHISYHVNDGSSLSMVPDMAIDFVFSFDSLVHADAAVLQAYLSGLAKKLTPQGVGFIHHSNMGAFPWIRRVLGNQVWNYSRFAKRVAWLSLNYHWRSIDMSANLFDKLCSEADLQCISQEVVNWVREPRPIDCFSVFTRRTSSWARPRRVLRNSGLKDETRRLARLANLYAIWPAMGLSSRPPAEETAAADRAAPQSQVSGK